jgi:hypothetical protein
MWAEECKMKIGDDKLFSRQMEERKRSELEPLEGNSNENRNFIVEGHFAHHLSRSLF